MTEKTIILPIGHLHIRVKHFDIPLEKLTGFASRNNSKRGFLFLNKVLGKHLPVRPSLMLKTHQELARKTNSLIDFSTTPVLAIGMAETATALGQGVFSALRNQFNVRGLYINSTRYRINLPFLTFSEDHSHASTHFLHIPQEKNSQDILSKVQNILLIDDEVSTGKTFINLSRALSKIVPELRSFYVITLLNWLGPKEKKSMINQMPVRTEFVSLLEGCFSFHPKAESNFTSPVRSEAKAEDRDVQLSLPTGRRGLTEDSPYPFEQMIEELQLLPPARTGPLLILGTGEFMYEPYLLARHLEEIGYNTFFQATTRSPILPGNDITEVLQFEDNYGEKIANFLYNVHRSDYDKIVLCYENKELPKGHSLPEILGTKILHFSKPNCRN